MEIWKDLNDGSLFTAPNQKTVVNFMEDWMSSLGTNNYSYRLVAEEGKIVVEIIDRNDGLVGEQIMKRQHFITLG